MKELNCLSNSELADIFNSDSVKSAYLVSDHPASVNSHDDTWSDKIILVLYGGKEVVISASGDYDGGAQMQAIYRED